MSYLILGISSAILMFFSPVSADQIVTLSPGSSTTISAGGSSATTVVCQGVVTPPFFVSKYCYCYDGGSAIYNLRLMFVMSDGTRKDQGDIASFPMPSGSFQACQKAVLQNPACR